MSMHTLNQSELYQKVSMYLDNALNQEESRILIQTIQNNEHYLTMLSNEQKFRDFVKSRVQRRSASPHLVQSIKEKIRIAPA